MTHVADTPQEGIIDNRYRIIERIADGGMATVYKAVDGRLERTVAVKMMHRQLAQGPHHEQFVERFHREARSAAAIANQHIVQVYDTGEHQGLEYLVMEYVHGVNLRQEMNQQRTFNVRETLRVVREILDGLASAHRAGVIHRDIKPENILINDRGHVQITDFGLAKATSQATLSSTGMLLGTAAYLPPEMISQNLATPQGDLYSVGIVAWEMLAGEVPFTSSNPVTLVFKHVHEDVPDIRTICPGVDPAVAQFITGLTARSSDDRPADATVAYKRLSEIMAHADLAAWQYRRDSGAPVTGLAGGTTNGDDTRPHMLGQLAGTTPIDSATPTNNVAPTSNVVPLKGVADHAAGTQDISSSAARTTVEPSPTAGAPAAADMPVTADMAGAPPKPPSAPAADGMRATTQLREALQPAPAGAPTSADTSTTAGAPTSAGAPTTSFDAFLTERLGTDQSTDGPAHEARVRANRDRGASAATTATQAINIDRQESSDTQAAPRGVTTAAKTASRRVRRRIMLAAAILAAILVTGSVAGWWYLQGPGSYWTMPKATDVACVADRPCTLAGASWSSYESTLKVAGIPYKVSQAYSDTITSGDIVSTTPAAVGDRLSRRHGDQVSVVVSRGIRRATIPLDITDASSADGKHPIDALKDAGFSNIHHDEQQDAYSETLPEHALQSIDPQPGMTLNHNAPITVVLSKGPMPVSMPDVVGRSREDAQAAFNDAKLKATYTSAYSDSVAAGTIVSVSVPKGSQLHWGDAVEVVVSQGPEMADVPSVVFSKPEDARQKLEALGFTVRINGNPILNLIRQQSAQGPTRLRDAQGKPTVITLELV